MDKSSIRVFAHGQKLGIGRPAPHYAGETIHYIEAYFDLDGSWEGYDSVRAIWWNGDVEKTTVFDATMTCTIPLEVVAKKGDVMVNLIASAVENDIITDRFTSYPLKVAIIDADVKLTGSETEPVTPSQFEQFVAIVKEDADRAETSATNAEASARASREYAESAEQGAGDAETYARRAEDAQEEASTYAENAQDSALQARNAKDDANTYAQQAEDARDEILGMTAEATTLPSGSEATASYSGGVMSFGIPKGDKGDKGNKGDTGATGLTPSFSIGTVETLEPNESATATITGTTDNPVLNLGIPKGDAGEVTLATLESVLPTDTASGSIATFPDGTSLFPAKAVKVSLEPIQDLHGYDKPWSGGNGKNLINPLYIENLKYINSMGYIGTTTGWSVTGFIPVEAGATYILNIRNGGTAAYHAFYDSNQNFVSSVISTTNPITIPNGISYVRLSMRTDPTTTAQFERGTTSTSWTPYENLCPISGRTGCEVDVSGKNLLNEDAYVEMGIESYTGKTLYVQGRNMLYSKVLAGGTYKVSVENLGTSTYFYYGTYATNPSVPNTESESFSPISGTSATITVPSTANYIACFFGAGQPINPQLELGSTATDYEPYHGNTYPVSWQTEAGTVYGGDVEAVDGELVDKMGMVDLGSLGWALHTQGFMWSNGIRAAVKAPSSSSDLANILCSTLESVTAISIYNGGNGIGIHQNGDVRVRYDNMPTDPTAFKAAVNGIQLCYELAQPQTYTLTETEISLLDGTNNVWSDGGDVEVTYKADIEKYIEKKLNN